MDKYDLYMIAFIVVCLLIEWIISLDPETN